MASAFHWLKLVVGPGGARVLAAVLTSKVDVRGKSIDHVLGGENVNAGAFSEMLAKA